jgi:hypothetical protein
MDPTKEQRQILCKKQNKLNSMPLVRERTIPTERPQLVTEVSANFSSVVSAVDLYGRNLGSLDRSSYFFF